MPRRREELLRRSLLDDRAEVHHRDAVAEELDGREVVGDEEAREAEVALEVAEQVEDRRLHRHVERGDGLVRDQKDRRNGERAREPDALPLAARELVRIPVPQLRPEADLVEELRRRACRGRRRRASRCSRSGSPTIWPQVMRGLSEEYGSWKTMCTPRRSGRMLAA